MAVEAKEGSVSHPPQPASQQLIDVFVPLRDADQARVQAAWKTLLRDIARLAQSRHQQKKAFISYAWPPAGAERDSLQAFLKSLQDDLEAAGITVFLDVRDMRGNLDDTMQQKLEAADFVLPILTPGFLARVREGEASVQNAEKPNNLYFEFNLTLKKAQKTPGSVIPLLRSGTFSTVITGPLAIWMGELIYVCTPDKRIEPLLVELSNPGDSAGLIPGMYGIRIGDPDYERLLTIWRHEHLTRLPAPLPHTIERRGLKAELFHSLDAKEVVSVQVICGVAGVGKTQLAQQYAQQVELNHPGFVRWIDANPLNFAAHWQRFGALLGLELTGLSERDQRQKIKIVLQSQKHFLLVLDGVENETALSDLLPENLSPTQQLLITTRSTQWHYPTLVVPPFTPHEAKAYFHAQGFSLEQEHGRNRLIQALVYHPQALATAVAEMKNTGKSAHDYCQERGLVPPAQGNDLPATSFAQPPVESILPRLQNSLRMYYSHYTHLERLFDDTTTPIAESFINLALIKETEHKRKEKGLGQGGLEEKDDGGRNDGGKKAASSTYVDERLASHEQLYAIKEPLALTELFEAKEEAAAPNKVLVLGRAGIGKSILCQYLATQWASEEKVAVPIAESLQKKFDAVFWIKLREVAVDTREGETLVDVLDRFCLAGPQTNKLTKQELDYYLKNESHKVLFILDGYDEITEHRQLDRLLEELAAHTHLFLTSRPIVIEKLGNQKVTFDRRLENMGFLNENIEAYIQQFMVSANQPEQVPLMLDFLKSHAGVWGIAHIPINLELLSWLWSKGELTLEQGQVITLSKLYQIIVDRIQEAYADKALRQPNAMESKVEEHATSQINAFLEYLAFHAMEQEALFIPAKSIAAALQETLPGLQHKTHQKQLLKAASDKLGFLRTTGQGGKSQLDQSHYFIHLSFQEFYAARYVARILTEQPNSPKAQQVLACIRLEKYTPRYQLMLWMSAGLLYQHAKKRDLKNKPFSSLERFWDIILSKPRSAIGYHHMVLVMHCLDECEVDDRVPLHKALIKQQLEWFQTYSNRGKFTFNELCNPYIEQLIRCPVLHTSKPIIFGLLEISRHHTVKLRRAAIEALGKLKHPNEIVLARLFSALQDEHLKVTAVEALSKLNNPNEEVVQRLIGVLQDDEYEHDLHALEMAGESLSQLNNPSEATMTALLNVLQDKKGSSRKIIAARVLGRLNNANATVVAVLLDVVHQHARESRAAAYALGNLGNSSEAAVQALLSVLQHKTLYLRSLPVEALGCLHSPSEVVVGALLDILRCKEINYGSERQAAAWTLAGLKTPSESVLRELLNTLSDKDEDLRMMVVDSLGALNDPTEEVISKLLCLLECDEDEDMRQNAAISLVSAFKKRHNMNADAMVSLRLQRALWSEGGRRRTETPFLLPFKFRMRRDLRDIEQIIVEALIQIGHSNANVVSSLLSDLRHENKYIRQTVAKGLSKLRNPDKTVIAALLVALQDKEKAIRQAAAETLCELNHQSEALTIVLLDGLQESTSLSFKQVAADRLSNLNHPSETVILALLSISQDKDSKVRQAAMAGLGRLNELNEDVMRVLLSALQDKDSYVSRAAAKSLTTLKTVQQWALVFERLTDEQCAPYFSYWFEKNYLLCIDHHAGLLIVRPDRQNYTIPLSKERLIYLEKQITAIAQQEGHPLLELNAPVQAPAQPGFFPAASQKPKTSNPPPAQSVPAATPHADNSEWCVLM